MDFPKLRFVLCPGRNPDQKYLSYYNEIYRAWHKLWSETYTELKDPTPLYSDAFTRQDFIAAVFMNEKCQGFILFRHCDFSTAAARHDSYFQQWSELHLKKLSKIGNNILICGNLGIIPEARGKSTGIPMKYLVTGFAAEVIKHSVADVTIATPRKDKGVHTTAFGWGGQLIAKDVDWGHGVTVDLAYCTREDLLNAPDHELTPVIQKLWDEMLVIPENPLETINTISKYLHVGSMKKKVS